MDFGGVAIEKIPAPVDFFEMRQLMVPLADLFFRVAGDELDLPQFVIRASTLNLDDIQSLPGGVAGPVADGSGFVLVALAGRHGAQDIVHLLMDKRAVAGPQQGFGRFWKAGAENQRLTALGVRPRTAAGADFRHGWFSFNFQTIL